MGRPRLRQGPPGQSRRAKGGGDRVGDVENVLFQCPGGRGKSVGENSDPKTIIVVARARILTNSAYFGPFERAAGAAR